MPRRVAAALARFGAAGQRAADDLAPRLQDTARSWHATRELACASAPARRAQLDACLRRSNRELQSLVLGLETVTTELAARFAIDAWEDRYFGWDATRYPSRRAHDRARAVSQLALAVSARNERAPLEAIVRATFR